MLIIQNLYYVSGFFHFRLIWVALNCVSNLAFLKTWLGLLKCFATFETTDAVEGNSEPQHFFVATYRSDSQLFLKESNKESWSLWNVDIHWLLWVSWREHRMNVWVLEQLGTKRILMKWMRKRRLSYFGHTIRHKSLGKITIQGVTAGKRGRGRPARTWEA